MNDETNEVFVDIVSNWRRVWGICVFRVEKRIFVSYTENLVVRFKSGSKLARV